MCNSFTKNWFLSPGSVESQTPEETPPKSLKGKTWLISQIQTLPCMWFPWCQDLDLHIGDKSLSDGVLGNF